MRRKGLWIVVGIFVLLALIYVGASWYFSELLLNGPTESIAEARAEGDTPATSSLPVRLQSPRSSSADPLHSRVLPTARNAISTKSRTLWVRFVAST